MTRIALLLVLLLPACVSPAPDMFGATRSDITLRGIRFVVFHSDSGAEVVRTGYLSRARRAPVQALMAEAAEQATGCKVIPGSFTTRLPGDTGVARMDLSCP